MQNEINKKTEELTKKMMEYFTGFLCETYRKTLCEDLISEKLAGFAKSRNLKFWQGEKFKNVIIYKDGTGKYKEANFPVILQAHMDMVCVSSSDKDAEDVFSEGVQPYFEDKEKNKMKGRSVKYPGIITTLGADDGIGVAAICAILDDKDIEHPPIAAIFTVEEEDGMGGADAITKEDITGIAPALDWTKAKLINVDDERDGIYSVSCAGSLRLDVNLPIKRDLSAPTDVSCYTLSVSGLKGGHSGICIHEGRANANILLCDVLQKLINAEINLSLFSFNNCGVASNAIPAQASAIIAVSSQQKELFNSQLKSITNELKNKFAFIDPGLEIKAEFSKNHEKMPYKTNTLRNLLSLVCELPNGVIAWVDDNIEKVNNDPPLVETSSNLGIIEETNETVVLVCMTRSSVDDKKTKIEKQMEELASKYGAKIKKGADSPGWKYKADNPLRDLFLLKYDELFKPKEKPRAVAIHAGLECGHFAQKLGEIDMIACGPELSDVHSIKETLYMDTVPKVMKLLIAVLEDL
ncbi:MAG: beta-Ala-His dipeptidase [Treponema sp.]|jgi:dipeptidase D|nr:beta-Ala-His dipeptidase [Treponema sp.]